MSSDDVHVCVVSLLGSGIRRSVTVGEERWGEVRYDREHYDGCRTGNPTELCYAPRQWEHAGTYHCGDYVRTCSHQRSYVQKKTITWSMVTFNGGRMDARKEDIYRFFFHGHRRLNDHRLFDRISSSRRRYRNTPNKNNDGEEWQSDNGCSGIWKIGTLICRICFCFFNNGDFYFCHFYLFWL